MGLVVAPTETSRPFSSPVVAVAVVVVVCSICVEIAVDAAADDDDVVVGIVPSLHWPLCRGSIEQSRKTTPLPPLFLGCPNPTPPLHAATNHRIHNPLLLLPPVLPSPLP